MQRLALIAAFASLAGCDGLISDSPDDDDDEDDDVVVPGTPSIEGTPLSSFETSTCSTMAMKPLSVQIAQEIDCMMPGQLVPFEPGPVIVINGPTVLPFLSESARAELYAAVAQAGGATLGVNSAFRTVDTQYLLRRWLALGRCDLTAVADPGDSNHESGRALDIQNYGQWIGKLGAQGWAHDIPNDPWHFEHRGSPDLRGVDVHAFQRLWNRNAPNDRIAEDGAYGTETETRLKRAPAEGFGIGALCTSTRVADAVKRVELATPPDAVEHFH